MARAGRKRKQGRRHPSGKLVRQASAVNYRAMAAEQPHRRDLPVDKRQDRLAASNFGRMHLTGRINELQHLAGERYAMVVGAYRATIQGPKAMSGSGRGYECVCARSDVAEQCECHRRRAAYERAFVALHCAGRPALMTVNAAAVQDQSCPVAGILELRTGLDALAKHFGFAPPGVKRRLN
jgi:hypothetical protein